MAENKNFSVESMSLVGPPIGGQFAYPASVQHRELTQALDTMTKDRNRVESELIKAHRLLVAVLGQAFGGSVDVDAKLLPEELPRIFTTHDSRTGLTTVHLERP